MTRRRLSRALVACVAAWPCVTLWLQARWDVDPWKLMSFGMYAAPARRAEDVRLACFVERSGAWERVAEPLEEGAAYRRWRRTLGRLASPEALGRQLLADTGARRGRLEVRELRLDRQTARVVWSVETLEVPASVSSPRRP